MTYKSDAGSALRSKSGREVIKVKTSRGLVPFSIKRKNIDMGAKVKSKGKSQ